jgi:hypothetical protein
MMQDLVFGCGVGRNVTTNESLKTAVNSFKTDTTTRKVKSGRIGKVQGAVEASTGDRARQKLAESNDGV